MSLSRLVLALFLASMGSFMLVLATSNNYWLFINPKYAWLTILSGLIITGLAFSTLLDVSRRPLTSELLCLGLFLVTAVASVTLENPFAPMMDGVGLDGMGPDDSSGFAFTEPEPEELPSRLELNGLEYVRINTAELLTKETMVGLEQGDRYVFQGEVVRTPEMDRVGYIAVNRMLIVCCFADALGVAVLVRVDDPEAYEQGSWVRAAGSMHSDPMGLETYEVPNAGMFAALTSASFFLLAEQVQTESPPEWLFIFEVREQEPFAY